MDNKNLYCTLNFNYEPDGLPDWVKEFVQNEFLRARNKAVDLLNPHYEEWNAAYDKEVHGEDDMEYNAYIQKKQNEILDRFNHAWMSPVDLWADEHADICGRFKVFKDVITMHMTMNVINEKEWKEYHSKNKEGA